MEVCLHLKLIILFNIASYAVYHPHTPESVSQVTVQLPSDFLKATVTHLYLSSGLQSPAVLITNCMLTKVC